MAATSVTRVRESPFRESDWDRRLDNMLEDLETGAVPGKTGSSMTTTKTQQFFSSQTQSMSSFSSQQGTRSQSINQSQQRAMVTSNGSPREAPAGSGYQLARSDSAKDALKDLESGILKSTNYLESHKKYTSPEGTQEFHEYRSGGEPETFNLERQVQHMIPSGGLSERKGGFSSQNVTSSQQQSSSQQSSNQQFTTYKVQSNQYTGAGDRVTSVSPPAVSPAPTGPDQDEDNRPGSRLKQNIDDLDTLLFDLNNAKNISDAGADYTASSVEPGGLDSDDYSETVGQQGHVKRTINAFNDYTSQMEDYSRKPPSPSPRRKTNPSPPVVRKTAPSPAKPSQPTIVSSSSHQSSTSYKIQSGTTNIDQRITNQEPRVTEPYLPVTGPPGSGQPFSYIGDSPPTSPDLTIPSYYTKYHTSEQSSHSRSKRDVDPAPMPFPSNQPQTPSTQRPPKRVEELMSEFDQFDSVHSNGSPTPSMFAKPNNSTVVVTELPDEPLNVVDATPRHTSPQKPKPGPKGPDVYYPPGSDFKVVEKAPLATGPAPADGGTVSLDRDKRGKGKEKAERRLKAHDKGMDGGEKQGAAVIPICLPLCCAAPCVIM